MRLILSYYENHIKYDSEVAYLKANIEHSNKIWCLKANIEKSRQVIALSLSYSANNEELVKSDQSVGKTCLDVKNIFKDIEIVLMLQSHISQNFK
jgi:hypothetical protein